MSKEGFIIYRSFYEPIRALSNTDKGLLFSAIFEYQIDGTEPESTSPIYMAFLFFKNQFLVDEKKYEAKCLKNKDIAKMRWDANAYERNRTDANDADKDIRERKGNKRKKEDTGQGERKKIPDNDNTVIDHETMPTFNDFWEAYDKKNDRPGSEKIWKKIKQADREAIMEHVPEYVKSTPDKKFRKNPTTYLNQRGWENEIIHSNGQQTNFNNAAGFIPGTKFTPEQLADAAKRHHGGG